MYLLGVFYRKIKVVTHRSMRGSGVYYVETMLRSVTIKDKISIIIAFRIINNILNNLIFQTIIIMYAYRVKNSI